MTERRTSPRSPVDMACLMRRRTGSAIVGRTVDLGPGGMSVSTQRPLAPDEVVRFELGPEVGVDISGDARVLRQQGYAVYALRFEGPDERLREEAIDRLLHAGSPGAGDARRL